MATPQDEWDDFFLDEYPSLEEEVADAEAREKEVEDNSEVWSQMSPFQRRQADPEGFEYYNDKED